MREIVSIHIGQAGSQIGSSCWELYCLEHGISKSGLKIADNETVDSENSRENGFKSFFSEMKQSEQFVPRAIFIDLEPTAGLEHT